MNLKEFKIKNHLTTIFRHIVQIIAFILVNYLIIEMIFSLNLIGLENIFKILPILNSPRNPLSRGAGIVEYMFFSITEGVVPIFLLGVFILIILFTNRFFCGWICPIGAIQDACSAFTKNHRTLKISTHNSLLKLKYVIIIFLIILLIPLGITYSTNISFYIEFRNNLGDLGDKPISYFSLSEYIFYFFPNLVKDIFQAASLGPLFKNFLVFFVTIFYLIIIVLSIWYPRVYCRYLCPFAALSSAINDYSFLKLSRSPVRCVGRTECGICEKVCPKQIRMLDEPFEFFTGKGECNFCLRCHEVCPYKAINIKFG